MVRTRVGYAGGEKKNPTYHDLGDHTETVQIDFDPRKISYEQLLDIFWASHNPAKSAWSSQYKHVLFYHDDKQKELALKSKERLAAKLQLKIHTEIVSYTGFYRAEDYHQKYKLRHTSDLMAEFISIYPDADDFVDSTAAARINGYLYSYGSLENLQAEVDDFGLSDTGKEKLVDLLRRREKRFKELSALSSL